MATLHEQMMLGENKKMELSRKSKQKHNILSEPGLTKGPLELHVLPLGHWANWKYWLNDWTQVI